MQKRLPRDIRFLLKAYYQANLDSTCLSRKVCAILVPKGGRKIVTGFNGPPKNYPHCVECIRKSNGIESGHGLELCPAQHAERNAMGINGESPGATLYISGGTPCKDCAGMAVNNGVVRIVCDRDYPDDLGKKILRYCGVELVIKDISRYIRDYSFLERAKCEI